jgi:hypothetical protein
MEVEAAVASIILGWWRKETLVHIGPQFLPSLSMNKGFTFHRGLAIAKYVGQYVALLNQKVKLIGLRPAKLNPLATRRQPFMKLFYSQAVLLNDSYSPKTPFQVL